MRCATFDVSIWNRATYIHSHKLGHIWIIFYIGRIVQKLFNLSITRILRSSSTISFFEVLKIDASDLASISAGTTLSIEYANFLWRERNNLRNTNGNSSYMQIQKKSVYFWKEESWMFIMQSAQSIFTVVIDITINYFLFLSYFSICTYSMIYLFMLLNLENFKVEIFEFALPIMKTQNGKFLCKKTNWWNTVRESVHIKQFIYRW